MGPDEAEAALAGVLAAAGAAGAVPSVARFGGAYPRTRRQRRALHRGFAVVQCAGAAAAAAAAAALGGCTALGGAPLFLGDRVDLRYDPGGCDLRPELAEGGGSGATKAEAEAEAEAAAAAGVWGAFQREAPAWAAHVSPAATAAPWGMAELAGLPMRLNCLEPNTMLADLEPYMQARLWRYIRGCLPTAPELTAICLHVHAAAPRLLRVKELIESLEAFKLCEAFLEAARRGGREIDTVWELACGHGLAGQLLAYRFPRKRVILVDLARRPLYDAFEAAFRAEGSTAFSGGALPLANVEFRTGDLAASVPEIAAGGTAACVVALHGCNEVSRVAVEAARAARAVWAVLPCCMRVGDYLPRAAVSRLPDSTRYALLCGVLAATYGAQMVRGIDGRITNRMVFLAGGLPNPEGGGAIRFHMRPEEGRGLASVPARRRRGEGRQVPAEEVSGESHTP